MEEKKTVLLSLRQSTVTVWVLPLQNQELQHFSSKLMATPSDFSPLVGVLKGVFISYYNLCSNNDTLWHLVNSFLTWSWELGKHFTTCSFNIRQLVRTKQKCWEGQREEKRREQGERREGESEREREKERGRGRKREGEREIEKQRQTDGEGDRQTGRQTDCRHVWRQEVALGLLHCSPPDFLRRDLSLPLEFIWLDLLSSECCGPSRLPGLTSLKYSTTLGFLTLCGCQATELRPSIHLCLSHSLF